MQPRELSLSWGQGPVGWGESGSGHASPLAALDSWATGSPTPLRQMQGSSCALGRPPAPPSLAMRLPGHKCEAGDKPSRAGGRGQGNPARGSCPPRGGPPVSIPVPCTGYPTWNIPVTQQQPSDSRSFLQHPHRPPPSKEAQDAPRPGCHSLLQPLRPSVSAP